MFNLTFHNGSLGGGSLDVSRRKVFLGRLRECEVCLADDGVSRRHCFIEEREDGIYIGDLGATNGVRINGARMREMECRLADGDEVQLGSVRFTVKRVEQASSLFSVAATGSSCDLLAAPLLALRSTGGAVFVGASVGVLLGLLLLLLAPNPQRQASDISETSLKPAQEVAAPHRASTTDSPQKPTAAGGAFPVGRVIAENSNGRLAWKSAAQPRADTSVGEATPSVEAVAGYLLSKTGDVAISVNEIPPTDTNAWALVGHYEAVASDERASYRLVGQHLLIADSLLKDPDLSQRRRGLAFAVQATRAAARRLKDMPLAVAIADSFLLPHFETVGDTNASQWLSSRSVLEEIVATYILAKDEVRQTAGYQLMLKHATDRNTADFVRFRLAQLSRKAGRDAEALEFLRGIEQGKGGMAGMRRLIPGIERRLQLQNKGDKR